MVERRFLIRKALTERLVYSTTSMIEQARLQHLFITYLGMYMISVQMAKEYFLSLDFRLESFQPPDMATDMGMEWRRGCECDGSMFDVINMD